MLFQANQLLQLGKILSRNLPRGILFGIPLVTICYLLVNISFLTVLDPNRVIESSSVATVSFSNFWIYVTSELIIIQFARLHKAYGEEVLGVMSFLMPLSVAFSTFGAANGSLFTSARYPETYFKISKTWFGKLLVKITWKSIVYLRMTYVAGREGHLPDVLSYVHVRRDTPATSLILNVSNDDFPLIWAPMKLN